RDDCVDEIRRQLLVRHGLSVFYVDLAEDLAVSISIAWAIAKAWAAAGARLIFNYQGERLKENVEELVGEFGEQTPLFPCDTRNSAGYVIRSIQIILFRPDSAPSRSLINLLQKSGVP